MARALIVGCGCRGRMLGQGLLERGWQVRGTSRSADSLAEIEAAGVEAVEANPDRIGTVIDAIEGVTVIFWLMGSAEGDPERVGAVHGDRLERLLEEIADTHVRGVAYELTAAIEQAHALRALAVLKAAGERWRIPLEVVDADPAEREIWLAAMLAAADGLLSA